MERVSPGHLCGNGGCGWTIGSTLQQSQHQPHQVPHEVPLQETLQQGLEVKKLDLTLRGFIVLFCRMLEVILIAMATTSAVFVVAMLLGSCVKKPSTRNLVKNCTETVCLPLSLSLSLDHSLTALIYSCRVEIQPLSMRQGISSVRVMYLVMTS